MRIPAWLARPLAGEPAVIMLTQGRAFSAGSCALPLQMGEH